MSRAYDKGYEEALNTYEALRPQDWHSEAHAEGWIYGLECLIDNYYETTPDKHTTQESLSVRIKETEEAIEETKKVIDQITGGKDHKNTVQKMALKIEELQKRIDELEENIY